MTYSSNNIIATGDYTALAGLTNTAAPDLGTASAKAGYLWGIGYGDRGYGQTSPNLIARTVNSNVAQEWQDLRTTLDNIATWQGSSTGYEPPSSAFWTGAPVTAYPAGSSPYDLQSYLNFLDASRANCQVGNMTLTNGPTATRGSIWGQGTTGISALFSVSFASEDQARFFFNTGGEIRLSLNHPDSSTPQDAAWAASLSGVTFGLKSWTTVKYGGATGTAFARGFYNITTGWQNIFSGNVNGGGGTYGGGGGAYGGAGGDYYTVDFYSPSIPGVNGGMGNVFYIRVTLTDDHTNAWSDQVAAGTSCTASILHATSFVSITSPSVALVTNF
jgi:hypothetical protein